LCSKFDPIPPYSSYQPPGQNPETKKAPEEKGFSLKPSTRYLLEIIFIELLQKVRGWVVWFNMDG
jgi:hypothetical protein